MDIYKFSELAVSIVFPLTWIPSLYKVIKNKSAKSFSLSHLITILLGFISNCIYTYSFQDKYIFYSYLVDILSVMIIFYYKIKY